MKKEEIKAADRLALNIRKAVEKKWIPENYLEKNFDRRNKHAKEDGGME